jgi:hypothetical protein
MLHSGVSAERRKSKCRITFRHPVRAKRLDCGGFSTAFRTHEGIGLSEVFAPPESAAEAGAVKTLRDVPSRFAFLKT